MLAQEFSGPSSSFSSTGFMALHDDALSAPLPYILLYKSQSDSEYAGDMTSYYRHGMLAAFHSTQQICQDMLSLIVAS